MLSTTNKFLCEHCNNSFALKYNYDRHISVCNFFKKTNREQNELFDHISEPLPSYREMFHLMKNLNARIEKLEKENANLKRYHKKQNKIDILSLLHSPTHKIPEISFLNWMKDTVLSSVREHLNTVFEQDIIIAIQNLLKDAIHITNNLPLKMFDHKWNEFYVFDESENKWIVLKEEKMNYQISRIFKQFLIDFDTFWIQPNREKIEKEESYKDQYIIHYKKILGDERMKEDVRFKKIRQFLYKELKQNIHENM
jgi:hypothetical protein